MTNDFTDLILLVGTNPLPNLVVAKYFIKENYDLNRIWFVYSKETENYKKELINSIEKISNEDRKNPNQVISCEDIEINERSSKEIQITVKSLSEKLKGLSVHLNYTCGTKAMVVHTYRILEKQSTELKYNISFSYLNAENFKIEYDHEKESTDDLRESIKINFDELVKLHDYKKFDSDKLENEATKDDVIKVFETFINDESIHTAFYTENNGYLRKMFENSKSELSKRIKEINRENFKDFIPNDSFKKVLTAFGEYSPFDENWKLKDDSFNIDFFLNFVDGGWLEYYVYKKIQKHLLEDGELKLSSKIYKTEKGNHDMEIDLTYVRGYQLFGISCTTSPDKYMAKSKSFEVIQRVKQLGGDESKSILINTGDNKSLEKSLSMYTGSKSKPFLILGLKDLKENNLVKEIKDFIFPDRKDKNE